MGVVLRTTAAACLAVAIDRATSIRGTTTVHMVGSSPATHPIVVTTYPVTGFLGRSSVPARTRTPPPTSVPNQKAKPPSPLRTSRTVSAMPATTSSPASRMPNHHVRPRAVLQRSSCSGLHHDGCSSRQCCAFHPSRIELLPRKLASRDALPRASASQPVALPQVGGRDGRPAPTTTHAEGWRDKIRVGRRSPCQAARGGSCDLPPRSRRAECRGSPPGTGGRL